MGWNSFVTDYLSFSKKDRIALFFILFVVAGCWLLPFFLNPRGEVRVTEDSLLVQTAATVVQAPAAPTADGSEPGLLTEYGNAPDFKQGERFPFDPNSLGAEGWAQLGLPLKAIRTISNYRNKGGRFYKKEDLRKIWSLPPGFYEWVEPFIHIAVKEKPPDFEPTEKEGFRRAPVRPVDINRSDTAAWIALPGIGNTLALRILRFRDRLGGFYSTEQVAETYGLPDSTFQKLRPLLQVDPDQIKKININTATKEELKAHPYLRWNLANAIVEYRNQHGLFKDLSELKQIVLVDENVFNKIRHYLILE